MKDKLILKDGTEIELEAGASLSDMKVISSDKASMASTWDKLTTDNLKSVQVKNGDGLVVGNYENLVLDSETSKVQEDGSILTSFHIRQKTETELIREEIEELKAGQEVQDGAISDLGATVSDIAGGAE